MLRALTHEAYDVVVLLGTQSVQHDVANQLREDLAGCVKAKGGGNVCILQVTIYCFGHANHTCVHICSDSRGGIENCLRPRCSCSGNVKPAWSSWRQGYACCPAHGATLHAQCFRVHCNSREE